MDKRLAECQRVIGYHFANPGLLEIALTHSSLRNPDRECNERLEFLGDSVLGLVVTEELYRFLPDEAEGELTRIKSAVVSRSALFGASTRLELASYAQFARGVGRRDELPTSVIANLVESVIGAIYLDAGYFPAREFILRHLGKELDDTLNDKGIKNYKSLLQHDAQQAVSATPVYRTVEEEGPHHDKSFTVAAMIQGREWGRGGAATKKEAEQEAARKALIAWGRRGRGRRRKRRPTGDSARPPADASIAADAPVEERSSDAEARPVRQEGRRSREERPRRDAAERRPERPRRADPPEPRAPKPKVSAETSDPFASGIFDEPAAPRRRERRPPRREARPEEERDERPARRKPREAQREPRRDAREPRREERHEPREPRREERREPRREEKRKEPSEERREPRRRPRREERPETSPARETPPQASDGFSTGLDPRDESPRPRKARKPERERRPRREPAEAPERAAPPTRTQPPAPVADDGFASGLDAAEPRRSRTKPARERTSTPRATPARRESSRKEPVRKEPSRTEPSRTEAMRKKAAPAKAPSRKKAPVTAKAAPPPTPPADDGFAMGLDTVPAKRKAPARKARSAGSKSVPKKAPAKRKATTKKAATKKAPAKKATTKKATAKKPTARKASPAKGAPKKKAAAKKAAAKKSVPKKKAGMKATRKAASRKRAPKAR